MGGEENPASKVLKKAAILKRWFKPEVYPLIVFISGAVSLASFMSVRNLSLNPEVRINKDDREAGLVQNFKEGRAYHDHALRRYVRNQKFEMMPSVNEWMRKWIKDDP